MTLQAVFFDMGGTIETYNFTPELRLRATPGLQDLLRAGGVYLGCTDEQLYELVSAGLRRYHRWRMETGTELPTRQIWGEYILPGRSPEEAARLDVIAEDLTLYLETRYYQRELRPEVPGVIEQIARMGLKIGLISNVSSRGQVPLNLREYGIYRYFDPIVLSSEYGRRKPDPAIFHYAARLMGVPTSACLYVGDRISRDVVGAQRAGFGWVVQIQHDFEHGEDDAGGIPDAVIAEMGELIGVIERAAAAPRPVPPGGVRALLFDAGDILYYRKERGRRLTELRQQLGLNGKPAFDKRPFEEQAYRGEISQDEYREALVRGAGISDPRQVETGKRLLLEEENDIHFFAGVAETLNELKARGYSLGIITDTAAPVHVKLDWFERGGFGSVWDCIISSKEIGVRKPDPLIYQAALRQLGVSPAEAIFVGHKPVELTGAAALGMRTIVFNGDPGARADGCAEKFSDLLKMVSQI